MTPARWRLVAAAFAFLVLGGILLRVFHVHQHIAFLAHQRAYVPLRSVVVPRPYPHIGQSVAALAFSRDGQTLVAAESQSDVRCWYVNTLHPYRRYHLPEMDPDFLVLAPDGTTLAVGTVNALWVYAAATGKLICRLPPAPADKSASYEVAHFGECSASPGIDLAAKGIRKGAITVWQVASGQQSYSINRPGRDLCGIGFSPDASRLAVASASTAANTMWPEPEIVSYDTRNGQPLMTFHWGKAFLLSGGDSDGDMALAFSPDGKTLAVTDDSVVTLWDTKSGTLTKTLQRDSVQGWGGPKKVLFSPDGRLVIAAGWGDQILVWSAESGRLLQVFHGPSSVQSLAVSPDGMLLASGGQTNGHTVGSKVIGYDGLIQMWDISRLR